MKVGVRSVVVLCALGMMLGAACKTDPPADIIDVVHEPSPSTTQCRPGGPLKVKGSVEPIPSRCPTSKPREVGYSEKIALGSFWAPPPCNELPDFGGSWWRSVPPYPEHMKQAGHEIFSGTMRLVAADEAQFQAPQLKMVMRHHTMRIPPKGRFVVDFKRVEGPVHLGGCD